MKETTLPRKRLPAAWAVLAVALALVFVLVSAIGLITWNSYDDTLERSQNRVASAAQVVSAHVEWLTAASLLLMEESAHVVGADINTLRPGAEEELALHLKHMPPGVTLTLVDAAGRPTAAFGDSGTPLDGSAGLTMAEFSRERPWYVSAMTREAGEGAQAFLVAHGIERNGSLIGAAVVKIPVEVMTSVWRSLDLGPNSTVGLLREDGWQVARHPPVSTPSNLGNYVLFTDYLKRAPHGVYDATSPVDGQDRIVGYRKVPNAPLVVTASISRSFAMTRLAEQMEQLALFLIPVLAGLGILSVWVMRLLRRDEQMRQGLAAAVERNNLLMREIHHRTKNNLQSVASLLKLQPISEDAKSAMIARIAAMSALHEQAYNSDQFSEIDLKDYLLTLVDNIGKTSAEGISFSTELSELAIDRDLAQPLGLIVNEVIGNSLKHAFAGRSEGRITVKLTPVGEDRGELTITDDGPGFTPTGAESGMGGRLIRAFAQQLGNDYSYVSENGTRFEIRFAARRGTAAA